MIQDHFDLLCSDLGGGNQVRPDQDKTKYEGVNRVLWAQKTFPILNPTMKVSGICIGSDKLGHFVQQGFEYYRGVHRLGGTKAEAEAAGSANVVAPSRALMLPVGMLRKHHSVRSSGQSPSVH